MFTSLCTGFWGDSLGILFVEFIRDMASAASLSLRTKVGHRAMGHTAMRRDTRQLPSLNVEFWEVPKRRPECLLPQCAGAISYRQMEVCGNPEPSWVKEAAARRL